MPKFQQGDVLIKSCVLPKGMKPLDHRTLAYGEATGHHHTITEGECELYEKDGVLYLRVSSDDATLTHQEHGPINVPAGDYVVRKVREWDAFEEEARNVQD